MEINRKQILNSLLEVIKGISDKDFQKRIWIRGEGPEVDDFDETVCNFFQDGDGVIKNPKEFGLTEEQYQLLLDFRNEFDAFCNGPALIYYDPQIFIDSPDWEKIVNMAKEVLNAFDKPH